MPARVVVLPVCLRIVVAVVKRRPEAGLWRFCEAAKKGVLVTASPIDTDVIAVVVGLNRAVVHEVVNLRRTFTRLIWHRQQLQHVQPHRIHSVSGNAVARKRIANEPSRTIRIGPRCERVVDDGRRPIRIESLGEVATPLQGRWDGRDPVVWTALPQPFIAEEAVQLLASPDGSANVPAKLVALQFRFGTTKPIVEEALASRLSLRWYSNSVP